MDAHRDVTIRRAGGRRAHLLRRQHRAARAAAARARRDRAEREAPAVRDRGPRARQRLARRLGRAARAPPAVDRGDRARPSGAARARTTRALLQRARGRYALLLNEDSELLPGAALALHAALEATTRAPRRGRAAAAPGRRAAAARVALPDARARRSSARSSCTGASRSRAAASGTRTVDWAQSAALLVRTEAAREIGWFDPDFFVYSDEVDFCKRLRDAGWRTLYVPRRVAVHHEQLSTGTVPERRIVELSRNRDRYMRKHHSAVGGRGGALAHRVDLRACARSRRSCCPATIRGATGATSPRRCARTGARACARPRSSTTAAARL